MSPRRAARWTTSDKPPLMYLVRHAKAGSRDRFKGPDEQRPLTDKGRQQANALAQMALSPRRIGRALSSPATRCIQTIEPMSAAAGVAIEQTDWLFEGADPDPAFEKLCQMAYESDCSGPANADSAGGPIVACTHGDIIWGVIDRLAREGVDLGDAPDAPKGGTWIVRLDPAGSHPCAVAEARLVRPEELL